MIIRNHNSLDLIEILHVTALFCDWNLATLVGVY